MRSGAPALALGLGLWLSGLETARLVWLDRAFTSGSGTVVACVGAAGALSTLAAALAVRRLARRPASARFAAALVVLVAGTIALVSITVGADQVLRIADEPLRHLLRAAAVAPLFAAYSFLGTSGLVLMPSALPPILAIAWHLARRPR